MATARHSSPGGVCLERLAGGLTQVPATGGPNRHTVWLAMALPNGEHRALEGQTHEVAASARAPVLVEFFTA
jgi:hypothetical protein